MDQYRKPVFDQLFNAGVLLGFGVDTDLSHMEQPGGVTVWHIVPDMAAEDKVDRAFDEAVRTAA